VSEVANFSIDDGADTPVSVTFKPETVSNGTATFRDDRLGIHNLMPRIKAGVSLSTAQRPTSRATISVALPIKKTVDGSDVVDYILRAEAQFVLPERCTLLDRKHLLAYLQHALDMAPVKDTVIDVSPIWG